MAKKQTGFCIYIDTFFEGPVPSVKGERDRPIVFETELEAQKEIADNQITRLQQFIDGERDFDDAMQVDEYVVPVEVLPDGTVSPLQG